MRKMAEARGATKATGSLPVLRVVIASAIDSLATHVRTAFDASALASTHELQLDIFTAGESSADVSEAEVLLADPPKVVSILDTGFPRLQWLQATFAGVNMIMDKTVRRDYSMTRLSGVFGDLMAEYVLGHVLQEERGLVALAAQQKARHWNDGPFKKLRRVNNLTLGVLGPGSIGQSVAKSAQGFGMRTLALKRDGATVAHFDEVSADLPDVLRRADYIVSILPSTPSTRGLLSGNALEPCGGAVLINVGRGDVIDEDSIINALDRGWISKAILDVFPVEPLPETSRLWTHSKVVVTPHISAPSYAEDVARVFVENLARRVAGEPMLHSVDWGKGY